MWLCLTVAAGSVLLHVVWHSWINDPVAIYSTMVPCMAFAFLVDLCHAAADPANASCIV